MNANEREGTRGHAKRVPSFYPRGWARTERGRTGTGTIYGCRRRSNYDRMECGRTTPLSTRRRMSPRTKARTCRRTPKAPRTSFAQTVYTMVPYVSAIPPDGARGVGAGGFNLKTGSCRGRHPMKEQKAENEPLTRPSPRLAGRGRGGSARTSFRCVRCFPRGRGKLRPVWRAPHFNSGFRVQPMRSEWRSQ